MIEETWLLPCVEEALKRRSEPRMHPTMIDIGANKGDWTDLLKDKFECVIAYEPDYRNVRDLTDRFDGCPNVWILPEAVGAADGTETFCLRDGHAQSSLSSDHPFGHGTVEERYKVQVRALPRCIDIWADFVKVDIEGGEAVLDYPENVTCYLIECHGTFDTVVARMPEVYAVWKVRHPVPAADAQGHCWLFAVREVPDGLGDR